MDDEPSAEPKRRRWPLDRADTVVLAVAIVVACRIGLDLLQWTWRGVHRWDVVDWGFDFGYLAIALWGRSAIKRAR